MNHVEIYYTKSPIFLTDEKGYEGRVALIFVFPGTRLFSLNYLPLMLQRDKL